MTAHHVAGGDENRWGVYPSADGTWVSSPPMRSGLLTLHFLTREEAHADAERRSHTHGAQHDTPE